MAFYLDEYIRAFWDGFHTCQTKNDYVELLNKCELMCIEYLSTLEGEEYHSFYDESPLLAMTSEVQIVCPEAVLELAEEKVIFSTAAFILDKYNDEQRAFLRRNFLKVDDNKVIHMDFEKKKKAE